MTTVTLNYWTKGEISRVYINEDRQSLGYFQKTTKESARETSSYYDQHRIAKGDTMDYTETFSFVGSDELRAKIIQVLEIEERLDDQWHLFKEVAKKARNGHANWYGNTPKKDIPKLKKQRDTAEYTI